MYKLILFLDRKHFLYYTLFIKKKEFGNCVLLLSIIIIIIKHNVGQENSEKQHRISDGE